jgi:hypothetical protein
MSWKGYFSRDIYLPIKNKHEYEQTKQKRQYSNECYEKNTKEGGGGGGEEEEEEEEEEEGEKENSKNK